MLGDGHRRRQATAIARLARQAAGPTDDADEPGRTVLPGKHRSTRIADASPAADADAVAAAPHRHHVRPILPLEAEAAQRCLAQDTRASAPPLRRNAEAG